MPTATEETKPELRLLDEKADLRLRKISEDSPGTLEGYAAVFNSLSHDLGGFIERIMPGAFSRSLAENPDVSARIQHEGGLTTLARTTNGTLKLEEDNKGLRTRIVLPDTSAGRDVAELVRTGRMDKMSFAFTLRYDEGVLADAWYDNYDPPIRELRNVNLHDVAPVDGPAYEETSISIRAAGPDIVTAAQLAKHRATVQAIRELQEWGYRYRHGLTNSAT